MNLLSHDFWAKDKVLHFIVSLLLSSIFTYILHLFFDVNLILLAMCGSFISLLMGIGNEYIQSFMPLRSEDIYDVYADTIGVLFNIVICLFIFFIKS